MTEAPATKTEPKAATRKRSKPQAPEPQTFYARREPIYPKLAHGKFRAIKWAVMAISLGIYYVLPWLRWDRGPGLPDQAVLLDFAHQRLLFFGLEIWAQEFYFVTGILIMSALSLFLVTAVAGRVWCGYACPQTVWTDLMIMVERLWQGDRNARLRLANGPWTFNKIWRYAGTHVSWLIIGLFTGGALIFYFRDAPTLMRELLTFEAPMVAYIFLGIFTASTYVLGGLSREQVCIYMCPWPRIQGAMFDRESLLITYRAFRGEPRGPHKAGTSWEGRGDCVDCAQCVAVCPMGIDIRNGPQLECIQCGLCIDACDAIMDKVGRPRKLIAYDSFRNLEAESHGELAPLRLIRPRTMLYAGLLALVSLVMVVALSFRSVLDVNVVADRNPLFVELKDGSIRNGYTVRILNKKHERRTFVVRLENAPEAKISAIGLDSASPDMAKFDINADEVRSAKLYVTMPPESKAARTGLSKLTFVVTDEKDGTTARRETNFRGPEQ